ncbi:MAG: GntR family transcriptional regulator [Cryobacterium sp.]|jgi:DNA-binding GntR family transcriptional regulator|nr:GntR family transcriptional regulator [Cryobacterium sp.]
MRASDVAYQRLRDDIIQWRLQPGSPLAEVELSARMGVSRTPVREALSRLIAEGLVSNTSGRTAVVTPVSREHIRKLFELREALDTQAARLAARNRELGAFEALKEEFLAGQSSSDPDDSDKSYFLADRLDDAIDEAMDNGYLRNALKDIRGHLARVRRHARSNPVRLEQAKAEHLLIIDAILRQDEVLAVQATAVHLRNSLDNILATIPLLPTEAILPAEASASPRKDYP